jgi:hypothetical protein
VDAKPADRMKSVSDCSRRVTGGGTWFTILEALWRWSVASWPAELRERLGRKRPRKRRPRCRSWSAKWSSGDPPGAGGCTRSPWITRTGEGDSLLGTRSLVSGSNPGRRRGTEALSAGSGLGPERHGVFGGLIGAQEGRVAEKGLARLKRFRIELQ